MTQTLSISPSRLPALCALLGAIAAFGAAGCTASGQGAGSANQVQTGEVRTSAADRALVGELLTRAAENGENDIIRFALASGADVDAHDPDTGKTPLILAAERGHVSSVALLIERGARVDRKSTEQWTPLVYAAARGQPQVARLLIGAGANVEVREPSGGYTPLMIAALLGQADLVAPLIDAGADVTARGDQTGSTALAVAAESSSPSSLDTMAELLIGGSPLEARDDSGATPLMAAAKANNTNAVNLLLSAGADPLAMDQAGNTAATFARERANEDILALLEAGV